MQLDLFDMLYEDFKFDKPIRTITSFSGVGFQEMGMDLAEIPFKVLNTVEIDKFAMLSYAAIHTNYLDIRDTYEFPDKEVMVEYLQERNIGVNINTWKQTITHSTNIETVKDFYLAAVLNNNLGDISKVKGENLEKDIDLFTYSFPCTDLSKAGQRAGLQGGTRSGLVYEVLRILHELKEQDNLPKVLIMENVIDLIQANYIDDWNKIALEIEQMGYTNFTQVLNARDYGVAQNRQRVFMVSILGDYNYNFPRAFELEYRLKDYLEDEVDESLYLSDKAIQGRLTTNYQKYKLEENIINDKEVHPTILARYEGAPTPKDESEEPFIPISEATDKGWKEAYEGSGVYINRPHQKRGVVQDGMIQTLKANNRDVGVVVKGSDEPLSIRRLSPREVMRLMGGPDIARDKQAQVTSNAQAYKQQGNGIVAQVIGKIIGMMWYEDENELNEVVERNSHTWLK